MAVYKKGTIVYRVHKRNNLAYDILRERNEKPTRPFQLNQRVGLRNWYISI